MAEGDKKIYGIDLGTTYSCIAYVDQYGKPVVVPNAENQLTTPSVVYNVHHVIPEPTAAAIAYGMDQSSEQVVLVFDLGGGTFDVTVIEVKPDSVVVLCTGGDHDLGGRNWDEAIAQYFADEFARETGVSSAELTEDMETWQELLISAEETKVALSSKEKHVERVRHGAHRAVVEVTRERLDDLTGHMRERAIQLTKEVIATAAGKGFAKIDQILLVGGSTYMPQIKDAIAAGIPVEAVQFDPNQAVAKGAALFGFKCLLDEQIRLEIAEQLGDATVELDDAPEDVRRTAEQSVADAHNLSLPGIHNLTQKEIRNVSSKSFGVVAVDRDGRDQVTNLITVDSPVPTTVSRQFGTFDEGQSGVTMRCMENVEGQATDLPLDTSTEIGRAQLLFTHALPKGSPVEVTFSLAADGLLSVHGNDLTTGQEIKAVFETAAILTPEEMDDSRAKNMAVTVT